MRTWWRELFDEQTERNRQAKRLLFVAFVCVTLLAFSPLIEFFSRDWAMEGQVGYANSGRLIGLTRKEVDARYSLSNQPPTTPGAVRYHLGDGFLNWG